MLNIEENKLPDSKEVLLTKEIKEDDEEKKDAAQLIPAAIKQKSTEESSI